jgi:hypothetical protein
MLTRCKQKHFSVKKLVEADGAMITVSFGMRFGGVLERVPRVQLMWRLAVFKLFNFLSFIFKIEGEVERSNKVLLGLVIGHESIKLENLNVRIKFCVPYLKQPF